MSINIKNEFNNFISSDYKSAINFSADISQSLGLKIYLIGGVVRDLILKNPIKDIDITVVGDAIEFSKFLEKTRQCKIISIQKNLKTAKVKFISGAVIDFASTREEYYAKPGILPIAVNFGVELEKDVKRRDFTINTIAMILSKNKKYTLIDYFNGYNDIKNKKIKILHENSFIDDPSRIIRAVKFQMRLDFEIEEKTFALMQQYLNNVDKTIPLERIKNELHQYLSIQNKKIYSNLIEYKVYKLISNNPVKNINMTAFNTIKQYCSPNNYWFIYMALLTINSDFENQRLNLTSKEKKIISEVKELLKNFPFDINDNFKIYNSFIKKSELTPIVYYVITKDKCVLKFYEKLKNIKVLTSGKDLINLGLIPSVHFKEIFNKILKEKLEGKLKTKEDEIKYITLKIR